MLQTIKLRVMEKPVRTEYTNLLIKCIFENDGEPFLLDAATSGAFNVTQNVKINASAVVCKRMEVLWFLKVQYYSDVVPGDTNSGAHIIDNHEGVFKMVNMYSETRRLRFGFAAGSPLHFVLESDTRSVHANFF